MDNLTHTLIGVGLARSGLSERFGRGTTLVMAVASNLPDIDVFFAFFTAIPSFAFRRMITHSFFTFPLLALASSFLFSRFIKNIPLKTLFGLCFLAMGTHVFCDLWNSYGVVVLWPFSHARYELSWVFIIDLFLLGLLLAPILLSPWLSSYWPARTIYRSFMITAAVYIGFCAAAHAISNHMTKTWAYAHQRRPSFIYSFPEALGGHRFRGVFREGSTYTVLLNNVLTHTSRDVMAVQSFDALPEVQPCLQSDMAVRLLWFFKAPVVWKNETTGHWEIFDLRFQSAVLGWRPSFKYELQSC